MKKTILALAVMLVTGAVSAFANVTDGPNQRAVAAFSKEFCNAKNISWQQENKLVKATFSLNNQIMFAYYSQDGELMAVVRNILSDHLPILLQVELKKNYPNSWITDLFEMDSENQTAYFIRLENPEHTIILKSDGYDHWTEYKN
jgi:isocitrate dehydrogenase kinase/phosphatase